MISPRAGLLSSHRGQGSSFPCFLDILLLNFSVFSSPPTFSRRSRISDAVKFGYTDEINSIRLAKRPTHLTLLTKCRLRGGYVLNVLTSPGGAD